VGAHVFPFVRKVVALPEYNGMEAFWKHAPLNCGIDPMGVIADDWSRGAYDKKKVAFLKELGRAAYESPVHGDPIMDGLHWEDHVRAERSAEIDVQQLGGAAIRGCPVCGLRALVQYDAFEGISETEDSPIPVRSFPEFYRCGACTFEIDRDLDNPRAYGLQLPDFWVLPEDAQS
jgi:hypothetical protein